MVFVEFDANTEFIAETRRNIVAAASAGASTVAAH
jgi:hypothetical protein